MEVSICMAHNCSWQLFTNNKHRNISTIKLCCITAIDFNTDALEFKTKDDRDTHASAYHFCNVEAAMFGALRDQET